MAEFPKAQRAVFVSRDKQVVVVPLGGRAYSNRSDRNTTEHVEQGVSVDGSNEQALACYDPQHAHGRADVKSGDGAGNVHDTEQALSRTHVPHDDAAVHRSRHNDAVQPANANARHHTDVPEHALLESQRARTVCALDVLPYRYAAVYSACHEVRSVVGDCAGGDGAGVHMLEQVGQFVDSQMPRGDNCGVKAQSTVRFFP